MLISAQYSGYRLYNWWTFQFLITDVQIPITTVCSPAGDHDISGRHALTKITLTSRVQCIVYWLIHDDFWYRADTINKNYTTTEETAKMFKELTKLDSLCWFSQYRSRMPHVWGCAPKGAMTPKFKLGRDFCTMFHHPMFTRSEVIVLTNKQTNKQTNKHTHTHTHTNK